MEFPKCQNVFLNNIILDNYFLLKWEVKDLN